MKVLKKNKKRETKKMSDKDYIIFMKQWSNFNSLDRDKTYIKLMELLTKGGQGDYIPLLGEEIVKFGDNFKINDKDFIQGDVLRLSYRDIDFVEITKDSLQEQMQDAKEDILFVNNKVSKILSDRILVKMIEIKTKSQLIHINSGHSTDNFTDYPYQGIVLKVGEGFATTNGILLEMDVIEGDRVAIDGKVFPFKNEQGQVVGGQVERIVIEKKEFVELRKGMIKFIYKD